MRAYTAEALVLRTYRYGEADRIVVFLTDDRGKKRGVAKNATKSRRRFGGGARTAHARARDVRRARRPRSRAARSDRARDDADAAGPVTGDGAHRLGHASYFAELLDEWAPDNATNERLFRLGAAVGDALGRGIGGSARAVPWYWLLRLEGVYPAFDELRLSSEAVGGVLDVADRVYVCAAARTFLRDAGRRTPDAAAAEATSSAHAA